jgi:hypothetical protein
VVRTGGFRFAVVLTALFSAGAAHVRAETPDPAPEAVDQAADRLTPGVTRSREMSPGAESPAPEALDPATMLPFASGPSLLASLSTQAIGPTPRIGSTAIVDPIRDRLIVFGGSSNTSPRLAEVWSLPLSGAPIWSQLAATGDSPAPRVGHTAIYDPVGDRMIVFGGVGGYNLNDVWALSLSGEPTWSQIIPAGQAPTARLYSSAIYDAVRGRMIVMGGVSSYVNHNDVWALTLSETPAWSLIEPTGERPSGRYLHTAIRDPLRDRLVICGGIYGDNEVWALPLNGASAWERLSTSGATPFPRYAQSAIYDSTADRMVLFGGHSSTGRLNDTWSLPLGAGPVWSRNASSTQRPVERGQQATACDTERARLVVFGGSGNSGWLNDTWVLPLQTSPAWSMVQPLDAPPPPAAVPVFTDSITGIPVTIYLGQSFTVSAQVRNDGMASDDARIVVGFPSLTIPSDAGRVSSPSNGDLPGFRVRAAGSSVDGATCEPTTASYLVAEYADDTWTEFGGETQRFDVRVQPGETGTFYVDVRSTMHTAGAAMCVPAHGLPSNGEPGHVDQQGWAVKRFAVTVLPLPAAGSAPVRRRLHGAIHDPVRDRMIVYGGWVGSPSAETWALSLGASPTWSLLLTDAGPSPRYGHTTIYDPVRDRLIVFGGFDDARRNDVWALSLAGPPVWTRLEPSGGYAPLARRYHSAIYDPVRDRMVIFGGATDSGDMDDTWALDLGDPRWTNVSSSTQKPSWRKYHSAVYDAARDRMVVFGGAAGSSTLYDDLWALSLGGNPAWSRLARIGDTIPAARSGATLNHDAGRDRFWVVGGYSGTWENDVWTYEPASQAWERTATWWTPMPGREMHTTIVDPVGDRLVVYGGTDSLGRLGDTWFLTRSGAPTWRKLGDSPPPLPPPNPIPKFTSSVSGVPEFITMGEWFQFTVTVRNDGFPSDDGRISVGFPAFTDPADSQWVSSPTSGDTPGPIEALAGATVLSSTCQPMTAPYLTAEYGDSNWQGFGYESNTVTFSVQPRTVGTFYFDLRATMRRAGGTGCNVASAVPDSGEGGHVDPRGWPVKRFSITVLPPLTAAQPAFVTSGGPSLGRITQGQSFTMNIGVRNIGPSSDDGRIVLGFPAFTAVGDSAYVSGTLSGISGTLGGDTPGYRELTAGSVLADSTCAPVVGSYLTAEYVDNDWLAGAAETNQIQVTVKPREAGTFYIDVRSTMRTGGLGACAYVNAIPPSGQGGTTDQQGWAVKRYAVTVDPAPTAAQPVFSNAVYLSATSLIVGQTLSLSFAVTNPGAASDDGRIVVGFPSLTASADAANVSANVDPIMVYREWPAGSAIADSLCGTITSGHLMVECVDADWRWLGEESHTLSLSIVPRTVGTFYVDIRTTMRTAGAGACAYVNAVPDSGDFVPAIGDTVVVDQQGWVVRRFTVTVLERPPPDPGFIGLISPAPSMLLGQTISFTAWVSNYGWVSDDGRISVSFPSFDAPGDSSRVWLPNGSTNPNVSGYREFPVGDSIPRSDCQPTAASHLLVEYRDSQWSGSNQENRMLTLQVTPRDTGSFTIRIRSTMHWVAGGPCDYVNDVPAGGAPDTDQQGWEVRAFTVRVNQPPPTGPVFVANVTGLPTAISLGENVMLSTAVRNDGAGSNDGRISFGFPAFTAPGDAQWVANTGASDQPGFIARPAGSALNTTTCGSVAAGYLVAEYVDDAWAMGEINTVSVVVQPQALGTFYIDVRATMRDTFVTGDPCPYPNAIPSGGVTVLTDPQGFTVRRFAVEVGPPPGPPTVNWWPIDPGPAGPTARTGSTAVYVPTRQSLVIYGGAEPDYPVDVWSLPLSSPGAAWSQITPGGPAPQRRTMHSMVYNTRDDQLVIFAGYYDGWIDDVLVMSMSGLPWWFPNPGFGTPPSARGGHTSIYDPVRHRMLVVGGYNGALQNDVWEYSPPAVGTWRQLPVEGVPMSPRAQHAAVYDPVRDRVVVIGGDTGTFLNDVWTINLSGSPTWQRLMPTGVPPSGRREHTAIYDSTEDRIIVYGGFDGARRGDVWALSLGGSPAWTRLTSSTVSPAARMGHVAVYDAPRHRMVMFGGSVGSNATSREVWALELDHPAPPPTLAAPGAERAMLRLIGAQPNPARGELQIAFTLENEHPARLELFDLRGRRVAAQDVGALGSGPHRVAIGGRGDLSAGVYLVRLTQGGRVFHAKACVVR